MKLIGMQASSGKVQKDTMPGGSKLFYHLPPTAVPISSHDVRHALSALVEPKDSRKNFISALTSTTGNPNCFLASSGRSALALILLTIKSLTSCSKVILPAYSCPTVAQAVLSAGLKPVFCDVSPDTLDMDRSCLMDLLDNDVLAIVPTHLYGLAQDISDLIEIGRKRDICIIEDAAQAFGATIQGRMVGNAGDFGFFSLGRGKCVPVGHGGVILTQDRFIPDLNKTIEEKITNGTKRDLVSLLNFIANGLATTPMGWWFIVRSPFNPAGDGMEINALPAITYGDLTATQAGIGFSILNRIDQINSNRRSNANNLKRLLSEFKYVSIPELAPDSDPVYLRFPIIIDEKSRADMLYQRLAEAGIGVSRSYVRTLPDMFSMSVTDGIKRHPGADQLAACLLTLPTHAYLDSAAFSRIHEVFLKS